MNAHALLDELRSQDVQPYITLPTCGTGKAIDLAHSEARYMGASQHGG